MTLLILAQVFQVHNDIKVRTYVMGGTRNSVNYDAYIGISPCTGLTRCYLSLQDGEDANLAASKGIADLNVTTVSVLNDLNVNGSVNVFYQISCLSSINVSSITTIRTITNGFSDSVFEFHNNIALRENAIGGPGNTVDYGDTFDTSAGTGLGKCSLFLKDGLDANSASLR